MAASTGPVLAIGAITMVNRSVFNLKPVDWRVPIATLIAAGLFNLAERAIGGAAVGIAWLALTAVVLTRVDPSVPSPAESAVKWFNER
jgi:hypothetical protein